MSMRNIRSNGHIEVIIIAVVVVAILGLVGWRAWDAYKTEMLP